MNSTINVHRFQADLFPVNAYLVETADAVVAIDATLGVSDGRALAGRVRQLGKPLAGVIVTHSHPDHYGAIGTLIEGAPVPVFAVEGVDWVIRRDDAEKEVILRPMFGKEWAAVREFPNRAVRDGERVSVGGAVFRVIDAGPGESPHDSWWVLEGQGPARVFTGDLVYGRMHAYLADGFHQAWLSNLERAKREFPRDAQLYMGHGEPAVGHTLLDWQRQYIERFLGSVQFLAGDERLQGDALVDAVTARMKSHLPTEDLLFLTRLSVTPLREQMVKAARR